MDINQILQTLDHLFATNQTEKVEGFLIGELAKALSVENHSCAITIMNELIGYYRSISRIDDSIMITEKALSIIKHVGLDGSLAYATTLLNGATAYRAARQYEKANVMYEETLTLYKELLPDVDYRLAGLYNNMSTLFSELKRYEEAASQLKNAITILQAIEKDSMEEAVSHTNLSLIYFELNDLDNGNDHLNEALRIFETKKGNKDAHYSGALAGLAQAFYKQGKYDQAIVAYDEALAELKLNFGENASYALLCENYALVLETIGKNREAAVLKEKAYAVYVSLGLKERKPLSGLLLSKSYYETYGKPMIEEKFADYKDRIAVGLVGYGSECFGFDDVYSTDHDFGPAFCMWLTDSDYEKIGRELMEEYEKLPSCFAGYAARNTSERGNGRVGVFKISSFYTEILGISSLLLSHNDWATVPEHAFATAVNGEVFEDTLGKFTAIRTMLKNDCPKDVYIQKIATHAATMAQAGQYNYARCMQRGDMVAANLALQEFIQATIKMIHVLNKQYSPYYKWMYASMTKLPLLSEVSTLIKNLSELDSQKEMWHNISLPNGALNKNDKKVLLIEEICSLVIQALQKQELTDGTSDFLEHHTDLILSHIGQ